MGMGLNVTPIEFEFGTKELEKMLVGALLVSRGPGEGGALRVRLVEFGGVYGCQRSVPGKGQSLGCCGLPME